MTKPHILLLRAAEDAAPMAKHLDAMGLDVTCSALIRFDPLDGAQDTLDAMPPTADALVLTSPHGLDGLELPDWVRALPAYCVGNRAQTKLAAHGFHPIHWHAEVASLISALERDGITQPLYLRAEHITQPIGGALEVISYRATHLPSLNEAALEMLNEHSDGLALITSKRMANLFHDQLMQHGMTERKDSLTCFCMSESVAIHAQQMGFAHCPYATEYTTGAFYQYVEKWCKNNPSEL